MTATTSNLDFSKVPYVEYYPELSFWYPALSFDALANMPRWAIKLYVDKLPSLVAQREILDIQASAFPHARPDAQRALLDKLQRTAGEYREDSVKKLPKSPVLMERQLAAMGVAVRFVDKKGTNVPATEAEVK